MKVRDIQEIETSPYPVKPRNMLLKKKLPVRGLDTEAGRDGRIVLIADDRGEHTIIRNYKEAADYLLRQTYRKSINFFFNLGYDTNALIKHLPKKNFLELAQLNYTRYKDTYIQVKPGKELRIGRVRAGKHRDTVRYYDVSHFYGIGTLVETYNKTFPDRAYVKRIDAGARDFRANDISREDILYCIEDSRACQELGQHLADMTGEFCNLRNYISASSISKAVRKQHLKRPYHFNKYERKDGTRRISRIHDYAWRSMAGGRIEVSQIGWFEQARLYDINSAYPSEMISLPSIGTARIADKEYRPDAIYSFYNCDVTIPDDYIIAPLKYVLGNGLLGYPTGILKDCYIDKTTYELLMKYDIKVEIKNAAHVLNTDERDPQPFRFIQELYDKRVRLKKKGDPRQLPLKLALNALWGCTCETTRKNRLLRKYTDEQENDGKNRLIVLDDGEVQLAVPRISAGMFFNPVIASETSSRVRAKIFEHTIQHQEHVIGIATDGIIFDRKINNVFDTHKYRLGSWSRSDKLKGIVQGNGIYTFTTPGEEEVISRFRGFGKINLLEILDEDRVRANPDMIEYKNNEGVRYLYDRKRRTGYVIDGEHITYMRKAPRKLRESIRNYRDFNVFLYKEKVMTLNFDKKRVWDRKVLDFDDLMNNTVQSRPIHIKPISL